MEAELSDLRQSLAYRVKLYGDEDPALYSGIRASDIERGQVLTVMIYYRISIVA